MNQFIRTYRDFEKDNTDQLEYASQFNIPDFVKDNFSMDTLTAFEYTLTFDDHFHNGNQFRGIRTITKLNFNSVNQQFRIETWTWNHTKRSDGDSVYIKISENIAKEMFEEHKENE